DPHRAHQAYEFVAGLSNVGRSELLQLADSNHVIIRALTPVLGSARRQNNDSLASWAESAIEAERNRIAIALSKLDEICQTLEAGGCPVTVMKTLEHWPDLGNDLDLFSTADDRRIVAVLVEGFQAR